MNTRLLQSGLRFLAVGAAVLTLSATQAFAVSTVADSTTPYVYDGTGGEVDTHYAGTFNLSNDANWGDFSSLLTIGGLSSFVLHLELTPLEYGFNTDRIRIFLQTTPITASTNPKLVPLNGVGGITQAVPLADLGIQLGGTYVVDQPAIIEVDLLPWFDHDDLKALVLNNGGIMNLGYGDDSEISSATLTVSAVPEPASLFLFGTGLVGFAAWRLRKDRNLS